MIAKKPFASLLVYQLKRAQLGLFHHEISNEHVKVFCNPGHKRLYRAVGKKLSASDAVEIINRKKCKK